MKNLFLLFPFYLFIPLLSAQPSIEWQKSLGGSEAENAYAIQQTSDGGYIVTGYALSQDGDISTTHGIYDYWVVKLSDTGALQWQKTFGGSNLDWPLDIKQTQDEGYIVAGFTESNDGDVVGFHGFKDAWVVKLSGSGNIEWQKALGGSGRDEARSIETTSDGGYIMAGESESNNGDASGNQGGTLDYWVVKLSGTGAVQWQKAIGGSNIDRAHSIRQTSDGGYIVAGESYSNDGEITGNHGGSDYWVVKLSNTGGVEWQKSFGGAGDDIATDIHETNDGYIVFGHASSIDGDVTGHYFLYDYWIVKLNQDGEMLWQKDLGGNENDLAFSGTPTLDGGYVVSGSTRSTDGNVINNDGGEDIWLIKLNALGELKWQKTMGGTRAEAGFSVCQTSDEGYIVAGICKSEDGEVTGNHSSKGDFWIVKLSPESVSVKSPLEVSPLLLFPNPAQESVSVSITSDEPNLSVIIYDLLGREISRQEIENGAEVELAAFAPGLYLAVASDSAGRKYVGKLRKD